MVGQWLVNGWSYVDMVIVGHMGVWRLVDGVFGVGQLNAIDAITVVFEKNDFI